MRYNELREEENPELIEIAAYIKNDCQQFLKESNGLPLYRGFSGIRGKEMIDGEHFYHIDFRDIRKPFVAHPVFFDAINSSMKRDGFEATRANSDLFTGHQRTADLYGKLYVCFPLDGYKFTYSTKVNDYLNDFSRLSNDAIYDLQEYIGKAEDIDPNDISGGIFEMMDNNPYETGIWWWDKIGDTYKKDDISLAIDSKNEVMVTGINGYYALDEYTYRQMIVAEVF